MNKMGKIAKKKKNEKELGLVVSQQTVIRNQAVGRPVGRPDGYYRGNISINFLGKKVGKKGNNRKKSEEEIKPKRIRPRRVPTDADSESGLVVSQLSSLKKPLPPPKFRRSKKTQKN